MKRKGMKAAGKRQKGARLERKIAEELRRSGLDKNARRSFQSGAQWAWKSDIYTSLDFALECKNQEGIKKIFILLSLIISDILEIIQGRFLFIIH